MAFKIYQMPQETNMARRKRIIFFITAANSSLQISLIQGISRFTQANGIDLLVMNIGALNSPGDAKTRNELLNILRPQGFDGYIVPAGSMMRYCSKDAAVAFLKLWAGKPLVTIGAGFSGFPAVRADYYAGMKALVGHFIEVHKARRIALIRGNDRLGSSWEKERAYCDALQENGLARIESLIIRQEIKETNIGGVVESLWKAHPDIQALIACNDNVAQVAMETLKRMRLAVPEKVCVGGFQNINGSEVTSPPLTTVDEKIAEQGYLAAGCLQDLINGKTVPQRQLVAASLVVRGSCCLAQPNDYYLPGDKKINFASTTELHKELNNLHTHIRQQEMAMSTALHVGTYFGKIKALEPALQNIVEMIAQNLIINDCNICLFKEPLFTRTSLMATTRTQALPDEPARLFKVQDILPFEIFGHSAGTKIINPLYIHDNCLGYMLSDLPASFPQIFEHLMGRISLSILTNLNSQYINNLVLLDQLTGLPNRWYFTDSLVKELQNARRREYMVALLFLDLDNFKVINDIQGHEAGDLLLKQVAKRLTSCVRGGDRLGRWGGDEFVIFLPFMSSVGSIKSVAERILSALSEPLEANEKSFTISGSIGLALFPQDGKDINNLLRYAEIAMYDAKQMKNTIRFYNKDLKIDERELILLNKLKLAIMNEELYLVFQPIVDINTEKALGFEALLRWQDKDEGFISPNIFIPLAEREIHLINRIGIWVLNESALQIKRWNLEGYHDFYISVNVSAKQFRNRNLVREYIDIIEKVGIAPQSIFIEVTESAYIHNMEAAKEILQEFLAHNIRIALDDFGTGYSSLNLLKQLHFHKLKIDKSYVDDISQKVQAMPYDPLRLAQAVIAIGKALNITILAEGVETREQLAVLKELGCDEIQGYYFSKPLPAAEIEKKYLRKR